MNRFACDRPVPEDVKAQIKARNAQLPYENPESWQPDWTARELREWAAEHGVPSSGEDS